MVSEKDWPVLITNSLKVLTANVGSENFIDGTISPESHVYANNLVDFNEKTQI